MKSPPSFLRPSYGPALHPVFTQLHTQYMHFLVPLQLDCNRKTFFKQKLDKLEKKIQLH
jgi:hypothetical protein